VAHPHTPSAAERALGEIEATHTVSEHKVYSVMHERGRERNWGFKELSRLTGLRSDLTIRKAIDGLIAKRSIEIVAYRHGDPLGPRYRVYSPREIRQRRRGDGIVIDSQSKRVLSPAATGESAGPRATTHALATRGPAARGPAARGPAAPRGLAPVPDTRAPAPVAGLAAAGLVGPDDELTAALRAHFPTSAPDSLARAVDDLHTILAAFLERTAEREGERSADPSSFVKCVRTALAARDAVERLRAPADQGPAGDPRPGRREDQDDPVYTIRKVAVQLREMHRADAEYSPATLREEVKDVCATAGIPYSDALVEEALGKVGL
jgi:hypothetical protein